MSDLPADRVQQTQPFANCGIDVFGPYKVEVGKATRRNPGEQKLWVLLVTCLTSRAVHTEMLPAMDTSAFKNALTRFHAIRGTCARIRSDNGTNFVGAHNQDESSIDLNDVAKSAKARGIEWEFIPPKAPHFG